MAKNPQPYVVCQSEVSGHPDYWLFSNQPPESGYSRRRDIRCSAFVGSEKRSSTKRDLVIILEFMVLMIGQGTSHAVCFWLSFVGWSAAPSFFVCQAVIQPSKKSSPVYRTLRGPGLIMTEPRSILRCFAFSVLLHPGGVSSTAAE